MDIPIDFLQKLDITNLLAMAALLWLFTIRMDRKFDKIDIKFDKIDIKFEKMDARFDEIKNDINVMKSEISTLKNDMIEVKTILRFKECCMIQDERQMKKAE